MADSKDTGLQIPLLPEVQLVRTAQDMLGMGGGGGGNVNFTPTAGMPALTGQDMNAIIQNFLRTDGQFLQKALQQNQAGMYNSTSRASMSKELLAQAAAQAVKANVGIASANASIASSNAAGARAAAGNGDDAATKKRRARQQLGLAAGIHYLRSPGGGAAAGNAWNSTKDFLGFGPDSGLNLDPSFSGFDTNFLGDNIDYNLDAGLGVNPAEAALRGIDPATFNDFGFNFEPTVDFGAFDFGSIPGVESTDLLPADFEYADFFGG